MAEKDKLSDNVKVLQDKVSSLLKRNEQQLQKIKQLEDDIFKWKSIGNTLPNCIYIKDIQGRYLWVNQGSIKQLRKVHAIHTDIVGKKDLDVFPTEAAKNYAKNDRLVLQTKQGYVNEEKILLPNGEEMINLSFKEPLYNKSGDIDSILGYTINITKLKKTQLELELALQKAEASNQAKTEFLENMRHDIRTPLAGIVGCAELLQAKTHDPIISEYAHDLVESSNALLEFLNNILEGIQVATGEIPLVKKKFDLRKQLEEIINLNKSLAAEKKLSLTLNYDEAIPAYLIGDSVRVQRIVLELLSNALTFTKEGQVTVNIKLKKKESRELIVEISVSDTGIGIPKDKQEEIFIRFKRLTPSYKGIYKGLGLGLTTVKQFIDDLGGEIYVKSELEQGANFTCYIPFQEPLIMDDVGIEEIPLPTSCKPFKKPAGTTQHEVSDSTGASRILVVEDNMLAAKAAAGVMSEFNCTIDIAADGKTAIEFLQKNVYQLILMDIGLPDTDGIALTHRIRLNQWKKNHATVPIIGLTAHIGERKQECLDAGMNAVIHKPLKKETVQELLTTFVQKESSDESTLSTLPIIKGAVVDFDEIKKTLKDEKTIEECRQLMITGLSEDLVKLADWLPVEDWESIQSIAHKWQGGATYYGAKRLEQSCKNFNDYWASGQCEPVVFKKLYHQLAQEMEAVIEVCRQKQ